MTRDGITVTVEQVVLESKSIELRYKAEGIPDSDSPINPPNDFCKKSMQPILRFPDWELKREDTSEATVSGLNGGYEDYYKFSTTPPVSNEAVFVLPCLYNVRAGAAPEDWEIPLHFIPAPPEMTVFPVTEIPPVTPVPVIADTPQESPTPDLSGMFLTLDRAVKMPDAYQIYATLHWENTKFNWVDVDQTAIHVLDASGQEVPFTFVEDENPAEDNNQHHRVFAVKVASAKSTGSLTVVVDSANAEIIHLPADATFTFYPSAKPLSADDPRAKPPVAKIWLLNEQLQIGARSLQVLSATADDSSFVNFNMVSDTGIISASVYDANEPVNGYGGGAGPSDGSGGEFSSGIAYSNGLPTGPVTVTIGSITVRFDGPWQATWTPMP